MVMKTVELFSCSLRYLISNDWCIRSSDITIGWQMIDNRNCLPLRLKSTKNELNYDNKYFLFKIQSTQWT